jgi:hypothetical protein
MAQHVIKMNRRSSDAAFLEHLQGKSQQRAVRA